MRRFVLIALVVGLACSDGSLPTQPYSHLRATPDASMRSSTGTSTPVTSAISDADPTIAPTLQIRSDGGGAYANSSTLTSVIQSIGDWELDSYNPRNSTRTMYLDFGQPIAGSGPNGGDPISIPSGLYKVHMISKCHLYNNSFATIAPGTTVSCPLHIGAIYVGTQQYAVQMNPYQSAADTAWVETNYANVACTSVSGTCAQWTLTPSGSAADGSQANVAALLHYSTVTAKGKTTTTIVKEGDFYVSFRINVSNP